MSRVLPILFNTEMVRAILDGRKTATRRCVKPKSKNASGFYVTFRKTDNAFMGVYDYDENERMLENSQTPPCCPGDILYVRETFRPLSDHPKSRFEYAADWSQKYFENSKAPNACNGGKWRPSIHMPKRAARIWLKVTDVRVERLQDITEKQAEAEGARRCYEAIRPDEEKPIIYLAEDEGGYFVTGFKSLWDSTIPRGQQDIYSWQANPWVWVIVFERCEKPEDWEAQ